jgi:hypothetical protein
MRYRLMATYRGVPYEAGIGPTDEDVVLFAACPPPEELGFEPATGHWRKQLRIQDVQGLWESRPMGTFRGDRCIVLDDLGDRLHIAYLGHDAYQAEQLGYWQVDRGVFELVTPRDEVSEIIEERLDYPHRATARDPLIGEAGLAASLPPADFATGAPPPGSPQAAYPPPGSPQAAYPPPGSPQAAYPPAAARGDRAQAAPPRPAPERISPRGATAADTQRDLAVIPPASEPPLPLEAAALRAASARTLTQPLPQVPPAQPQPVPAAPAPAPRPAAASRRRRSALRRQATQRIFSELASLAAIPPSAYAVGEEVDGAMCLIQTPDGFEVFNAAAGSRHEVRLFDDEESAYFYLFGVLAAEAVRTGRLAPND